MSRHSMLAQREPVALSRSRSSPRRVRCAHPSFRIPPQLLSETIEAQKEEKKGVRIAGTILGCSHVVCGADASPGEMARGRVSLCAPPRRQRIPRPGLPRPLRASPQARYPAKKAPRGRRRAALHLSPRGSSTRRERGDERRPGRYRRQRSGREETALWEAG